MPIYQIAAPDGKTYRISGPDGASKEDVISAILAKNPDAGKPQEYAGLTGSFMESAKTLTATPEAAAFAANPNDQTRKAFLSTQESKYKHVGGFGEGHNWEYIKEMLGGSLGQMAAPAAAATAAGAVTGGEAGAATAATVVGAPVSPIVGFLAGLGAAGAAGYATNTAQYEIQGLARQAQEQQDAIDRGEKPNTLALGKSAISALASAGLDLTEAGQFQKVFKATPMVRNLLGHAGEGAAKKSAAILEDAAKKGTLQFAGNVAKGVGKGVAFEVPQEVAQQGLERWQAGLSLSDKDAQDEYKQAAIGALVLGGALGAGEGGLEYRKNTQKAKPTFLADTGNEAAPPSPETPAVTPVDRSALLARLKEAAGPDTSYNATAGVGALERKLSNDLSFGSPEHINSSLKYIRDQEDNISAGKHPEDYIDPMNRALTEARKIIDEHTNERNVNGNQEPSAAAVPETPAPETTPATGSPIPNNTGVGASIPSNNGPRAMSTPNVAASAPNAGGMAAAPEVTKLPATGEAAASSSLNKPSLVATPPLTVVSGTKIKKTPDGGTNHIVELSDGTTVTMFRDTDQFGPSNPVWYVEDPLDISSRSGTYQGGIGSTKQEALENVAARVAMNRAPVETTPAPVETIPAPVETIPAPVETIPAPVETIPAPVEAAPAPIEAMPEPVGPMPPEVVPEQAALGENPNAVFTPASNLRVNTLDKFATAEPLGKWVKELTGREVLPEDMDVERKLETLATKKAGEQRILERNYFNPLLRALKTQGVDLQDFGMYLWARATPDKNRIIAERNATFPQGGAGMTDAEAASIIHGFKKQGLLPKLEQLARMHDRIVDFTLAEKVKNGLLSKDQAAKLRKDQPFYTPMKGFAADGDMLTADLADEAQSGDRFAQESRKMLPSGRLREYTKAYGREKMPFHPLVYLFQDAEQAAKRSVTNDAYRAFHKMYKESPEAFDGLVNSYSDVNPKRILVDRSIPGGRYEPLSAAQMQREAMDPKNNIHIVKDNGVAYYYKFKDTKEGQALDRMFKNIQPEQLKGVMAGIAKTNNFLKGMLTYKNPLYLMTVAPLRDATDAIATVLHHQNLSGSPAFGKRITSKTLMYYASPSTWAATSKFVFGKGALTDDAGIALEEMVREGGAPLHTKFLDVQGRTSKAIKSLQGVDNLGAVDRAKHIGSTINHVVDGIADMADIVARLAAYRACKAEGLTPSDSARIALDSSLNLTRRGEMAQKLDLILPFFGASMEGSRKVVRIATNPRSAVKIIGGLIAYGVMESMWNAGQSGDNDDDGKQDYLDVNPGLRMSQLVLFHGSGGDDYVHIPIGQMLGYFKFIGNKIGDVMVGASTTQEASVETTEAMQQLGVGLFSLLSPTRIPSADIQSGIAAFTPLIGKPWVENAMNQNYFGNPIYQEHYSNSGPRSEQGRPATLDMWKSIAKGLNSLSGGSEAVGKGLDYQPEIYQHIVEGYLGGPGQLVKQVAGMDTSEGIAGIPVAKNFVGTSAKYAPQSKYMDNSQVIGQIMGRLKDLTPEQQAEQGRLYPMDTDPRIVEAYRETEKSVGNILKARKADLAGVDDPAERKRILGLYQVELNKYYSAFNYVYNKVKVGQ